MPRQGIPGKIRLSVFIAIASAACSLPSVEFHSLLEDQPYVLEVDPPAGQPLEAPAEIRVRFSRRMDLSKINPQSVALLSDIRDMKQLQDLDDLMDGLKEAEFSTLPVQYFLEEDETTLTLSVEGEMPEGSFHLVITPDARSAIGIPFNQRPGETPTAFIAEFFHGQAPRAPEGDDNPNSPLPGAETFGPPPEILLIHEFLYDGLESETDGEAFVELWGTPGADISLYQVLFVNGADGAEIDRVTLPMGTLLPEDGIWVIADLRTNSSTVSKVKGADYLDHFDPQNGPDGLQLLDRDGNLIDTVAYGAGAATLSSNGLALGEGNPAKDVAGGHSLSRINGQDTQDNATDFMDLSVPTPGEL